MKWLFVLFLAIIIFGGAAWFGYNFVFKEDIQVRKEQRGEVAPEPRLDLTLPEYEAAAKLRQEGKIPEARAALTAFIQKYPTSPHAKEPKDLFSEKQRCSWSSITADFSSNTMCARRNCRPRRHLKSRPKLPKLWPGTVANASASARKSLSGAPGGSGLARRPTLFTPCPIRPIRRCPSRRLRRGLASPRRMWKS